MTSGIQNYYKLVSIFNIPLFKYKFVYSLKGLEKGAEPPPPPPAEEPRTPSDEERNQSVELEIEGLNVSQVGLYFLVLYVWVIHRAWGQNNWILFYARLWAKTESRSITTQGAYCMEKEYYFLVRVHSANTECIRSAILPAREANRRIWFTLPAHGASHVIYISQGALTSVWNMNKRIKE